MDKGTVTFRGLTKRFGSQDAGTLAVDDLSFDVEPGRVTGFLGPNGAGKTTSLRCLLGLVAPTDGEALINGQPYDRLPNPGRQVGASLEATGFYPGRRAEDHLRVIALASGIDRHRVAEVLELVNLMPYARRRVGQFSLGMRQRLALAAALLGDPQVLVLDEPANGLDPQGIAWLRGFLRGLAAQGRTVLVSSHVLREVQQTVDDVVIISRGRLVLAQPLTDLVAEHARAGVRVRSPRAEDLRRELAGAFPGAQVQPLPDGALVLGPQLAEVGGVAHRAGLELHELACEEPDLEQVFLSLTGGGQPAGGTDVRPPTGRPPADWAPPTGNPIDRAGGAS